MPTPQFATGALKDKKDVRDYKYATIFKALPQLPDSVDYSRQMPPTRNQRSRGACVAFGTVAVKEYQENKEIGKKDDIDLSEEFVYQQIRHKGGGAYPRDAMQLLVERGVCLEKTFPYKNDFNDDDDDEAGVWDKSKHRPMFKEAMKYKAKSYVRLQTWEEMQQSLVANGPFLLAIRWYSGWYKPKKKHTDNFPIIDSKDGNVVGGHAICCVGYEVIDGIIYFKIRNSWGSAWGFNGYAYISSKCLGVYDAWATFDRKSPLVNQAKLPKKK